MSILIKLIRLFHTVVTTVLNTIITTQHNTTQTMSDDGNAAGKTTAAAASGTTERLTVDSGGKTWDLTSSDTMQVTVQAEGELSTAEAAELREKILSHVAKINKAAVSNKDQLFYAILLDLCKNGTSDKRQFQSTIQVGNVTYKLQGCKEIYAGRTRRFGRSHYQLAVQLLELKTNEAIALYILQAHGRNLTDLYSIGSLLDFAPPSQPTKPEVAQRLRAITNDARDETDPYAIVRAEMQGREISDTERRPGQL